MDAINSFALEIGRFVIGGTILLGIVWLSTTSPLASWLFKVALLSLWGVATIGSTLFVIFVIDLPHHQYGTAFLTLLVGGFLSSFWVFIGLPALLQVFKDMPRRS